MGKIKGHLALTGSVTFIVCSLGLFCVRSKPLCILRYFFILYLRLSNITVTGGDLSSKTLTEVHSHCLGQNLFL